MGAAFLTDFWLTFFGFLVLAYFPIASFQMAMMVHSLLRRPGRKKTKPSTREPGRRVLVVVCTNGGNPTLVEWIFAKIRSYALPLELFVIHEAADTYPYSVGRIAVPADYRTRHGSRRKMRALQYGIEYLHGRGYGRETYICHLDDDALVEKEYLEHIFTMTEEGGQGAIRLREVGHHLLSSLADMARVFNCDTFCRTFNGAGRPMEVHGEGLVVRADVEHEIGWDFATFGAEDLMLGQSLVKAGYRFGFIPYVIEIAPPTSTKDFYRQRRRWIYSLLWSTERIRRIRRVPYYWLIYRYATTWTGFVGLILLPLGLVGVVHLALPAWLLAISVFNTFSYFASYQYGSAKTKKSYMPLMLLLQLAVAFYEGATLVYSALRPPDVLGFDVIRKV